MAAYGCSQAEAEAAHRGAVVSEETQRFQLVRLFLAIFGWLEIENFLLFSIAYAIMFPIRGPKSIRIDSDDFSLFSIAYTNMFHAKRQRES
ncbi:MAG: hypothetical protein ACREQI_01120 [Candidatus Binataceae bacterium]